MRAIALVAFFFVFTTLLSAQSLYKASKSELSFFSSTPMEDIKAVSKEAQSLINPINNEIAVVVGVSSFHFPSSLMEEHFNENYMESEKYPKSSFKGTIADISKVKLKADGTYPVNVSGDLTLHGVTGKVNTKGTLTIKGGKVTGHSVFTIALADYKIEIPKLVEKNISKTIEITVRCLYDQQL